MSHLFIVKKSDGYHIDALFSKTMDGDHYAAHYSCTHRKPTGDDGVYDFYDCVRLEYGREVSISSLSFNPRLFQVVVEREEVGF